jgi:type II secretory pathway pseudopilin PulG
MRTRLGLFRLLQDRTSPPCDKHPARRQLECKGESGFTIVETLVTLVVVSLILSLILGFLTNLVQQSTNVSDTMRGVQQDQTAGEALLQYLHGTIVILPGSSATVLNASILAGVSSSAPQTATLTSVLTPPSNPKLDATFTTSLSPDGVHFSNVATYDAENSSPVFTYYYNNYNVTPVVLASTTTPTNAQLSEIVAVGISVTFLAGPQTPKLGYQAIRATEFKTTIYLQNASGAPAPTTSVAVSATGPNGVITLNMPVTLTATVSPVPDGGTINFSVTQGGSALSVCTAPVAVNTSSGTATCQFTPTMGGAYSVSAAFSGTSDFQPSTSAPTLVVVPIATSLSISGTSTATTITITTTLTPSSGPTGTISLKLQLVSGRGCSNAYTASHTYPTQTNWPFTGVHNNCTYTATASYLGNSNYAASSASPISVSTS